MIKKKRVAAICKSQRRLTMQTTPDNVQWIGDGRAMYILAGIEPMSAESIASMLDYSEKDISNISFSEGSLPDELFGDDDSGDIQIETSPKRVIIKNAEYLIFETLTKLIFVNGECLKPIVADDQTTYFIRSFPGSKHNVLCVKKGFLPEAIIAGIEFKEDFLNDWFDELGGIINAITEKYISNLDGEGDIDEQVKLGENDDKV